MRRAAFLLLFLLVLLAGAPVRAAGPAAPAATPIVYQGILAHAGDERMWIARVADVNDGAPTHSMRTDILIRRLSETPGKEDWKSFATVPARVTAMANRGDELAVLLDDGSWMRIWSADGAAGGAPLPAGGQLRTLANDASSLWAIGSVRGGLYAALQAVEAADSAATQPATAPAPAAEGEPNHAGSMPNKLVLFHERQGSWTPVADLPADAFVPTAAPLALAIVGGDPVISLQLSTGSVRTLRFGADFHWQDVGVVHAPDPAGRINDFCLLPLGDRPLLWIGEARSPTDARVMPISPAGDARWAGWLALPAAGAAAAEPVMLGWKGDALPQGEPALALGQGELREFALHGDKIYEQAYGVSTAVGAAAPAAGGATGLGSPLGSAAPVEIPNDAEGGPLQYGINGALLVALGFSVLATMYRRRVMLTRRTAVPGPGDADSTAVPAPPPPAPLVPRLIAGLIDLLPVLACSAVLTVRRDVAVDPLQQLSSNATLTAICFATGIYVLHTTLSEVLGGRTLGKWALGLRAVTVTGERPTNGQMVLRNVLRIVDLLWFPLVLVLLSPLRQRSADVAAGTMVVRERDAGKVAGGQGAVEDSSGAR